MTLESGRRTGAARRGAWIPILALAAVCTDEPSAGPAAELEPPRADEIVYGAIIRMSNAGVREATLRADSMFSWRDSTHAAFMGLSVDVFDEQGEPRATISAERGRLHVDASELTASGNAVLTVPGRDLEIRTEELRVSPERGRVWSDLPTVMREGACEVEGDRMTADMAFEDVKIWGTRTRERDCARR